MLKKHTQSGFIGVLVIGVLAILGVAFLLYLAKGEKQSFTEFLEQGVGDLRAKASGLFDENNRLKSEQSRAQLRAPRPVTPELTITKPEELDHITPKDRKELNSLLGNL